MKIATTLLIATFAASAWAQAYPAKPLKNDPYNNQGDPNYRYRGSSGVEYQYDRSRPRDELLYELDLKAKLKDSVNVDPRRDLDNGLGQRGGGARRP